MVTQSKFSHYLLLKKELDILHRELIEIVKNSGEPYYTNADRTIFVGPPSHRSIQNGRNEDDWVILHAPKFQAYILEAIQQIDEFGSRQPKQKPKPKPQPIKDDGFLNLPKSKQTPTFFNM